MRKLYVILIFLLIQINSFATHISGAEVSYDQLGPNTYRIKVKYYGDCRGAGPSAEFNANVTLQSASNSMYLTNINVPRVANWSVVGNLCAAQDGICAYGQYGYWQANYEVVTTFNPAWGSVLASVNLCCRTGEITNMSDPTSSSVTTGVLIVPQSSIVANFGPTFINSPVIATPTSYDGTYSFSHLAIDPDGDNLVYRLEAPLVGINTPTTYAAGYSAASPFGNGTTATINPATGLLTITGITTARNVQYVIAIDEYRNGVLISTTRRDISLRFVAPPSYPVVISDLSSAVNGAIEMCGGGIVRDTVRLTDLDANDLISATVTATSPHITIQPFVPANPLVIVLEYNLDNISPGQYYMNINATDGRCPFPLNSNKTLSVTILGDTIPPVIACPADTSIFLNDQCQAVVPDFTTTILATDNCIISTFVQSPAAGTVVTTDFVLQLIATDYAGMSDTCYSNVSLVDITPPVVQALQNITGECMVAVPMPTAQDGCDGVINGTTTDLLIYETQGTHVVNWTFTDAAGNFSTAQQTIILDDVTPPNIPVLPTITEQCQATVTPPTTTDACAVLVTGTTTDPLEYLQQGTYTITWTFDDGNGNTSTALQTVIVDDNTPPVVPALATAVGECTATIVAPTANDACMGAIVGTTTSPLTFTSQGTYTVTWSFDDGNGNVSTTVQYVIIDDVTPPVAPVLNDITAECSATLIPPTAPDNCSGNITATTTSSLTFNAQGTFTVLWIFDDGNGNISTATQNVIINDVTPPVVSALPTINAECAAILVAPTAEDVCSGTITATTLDPIIYEQQGSYIVNWNFDDGNGNIATAPQNVVVQDVTPPVLPNLSTITGECFVQLVAPETYDECVGTIVATTTDPLSYSQIGTYTVTWIFNDGNGTQTVAQQEVIVNDLTPPVVPTIESVYGTCTASVTAPQALDNCAGIIIGTTTDAITYTTVGIHVINWNFDDGHGNVTTTQQFVYVIDTIAPVQPQLDTITGVCTVTVPVPSTMDACAGSIDGTTSDPLVYNVVGTYTVHWVFNDGNGNSTTANQIVVVEQDVEPTFALADSTCFGTSIQLPTTSTNNVLGYWSPAFNDELTTSYTFTPTVGCNPTTTHTVTIIPLEVPSFTNPGPVCIGTQVVLPSTSVDNISGYWLPAFNDQVTTEYMFTVTQQGCYDNVVMEVEVYERIDVEVSGATQVCQFEDAPALTFTANIGTGPFNYRYVIGNGSPVQVMSEDSSLVVDLTYSSAFSTQKPGCYDVAIDVTFYNGCKTSVFIDDYICVLPTPSAAFTIGESFQDGVYPFQNESIGADTYEWNFGDGSDVEYVHSPNHTFSQESTRNFDVQLVAYSVDGCSDTMVRVISIMEEILIYIPNTFTPNGDEFNNVFLPVVTSGVDVQTYEFVIYNRWGQQIFVTHDVHEGWNGTYDGVLAPVGGYSWTIKFKKNGQSESGEYKGNLNLLR